MAKYEKKLLSGLLTDGMDPICAPRVVGVIVPYRVQGNIMVGLHTVRHVWQRPARGWVHSKIQREALLRRQFRERFFEHAGDVVDVVLDVHIVTAESISRRLLLALPSVLACETSWVAEDFHLGPGRSAVVKRSHGFLSVLFAWFERVEGGYDLYILSICCTLRETHYLGVRVRGRTFLKAVVRRKHLLF